jgi:hypothetical protein
VVVTRPIDVHIEELLLDGVGGDATAFGDALKGELARLLLRDGLVTQGGTADRMSIDVDGASSAAGVARALQGGIGRCST